MNVSRSASTACAVAAAVVVVASATPWVQTGEATRSGFALAVSARQAAVLDGAAQRAAAVALLFVPLAAALALGGAVFRRAPVAAAAAAFCGVVGLVVSLGVLQSNDVAPLGGAWAGLVASCVALATVVFTLITFTRRSKP